MRGERNVPNWTIHGPITVLVWHLYNTPLSLLDLNLAKHLHVTVLSGVQVFSPNICNCPFRSASLCFLSYLQKKQQNKTSSSCKFPPRELVLPSDQHRWREQSGPVLQECEVWEDTAAVAWEAETPATGPCRHLTPRRPPLSAISKRWGGGALRLYQLSLSSAISPTPPERLRLWWLSLGSLQELFCMDFNLMRLVLCPEVSAVHLHSSIIWDSVSVLSGNNWLQVLSPCTSRPGVWLHAWPVLFFVSDLSSIQMHMSVKMKMQPLTSC